MNYADLKLLQKRNTQETDSLHTWRSARKIPITNTIGRGAPNHPTDVKKVERALGGAGALRPTRALKPTGRYDVELQTDIVQFQRANALKPDGILGPDGPTQSALATGLKAFQKISQSQYRPRLNAETFAANGRFVEALTKTYTHANATRYIAEDASASTDGEAHIADLLSQLRRRDPRTALSVNAELEQRLSAESHRRLFALAEANSGDEGDEGQDGGNDEDSPGEEPPKDDGDEEKPDDPGKPDEPEEPEDPDEPEEPDEKPDEKKCDDLEEHVENLETGIEQKKTKRDDITTQIEENERMIAAYQSDIAAYERAEEQEPNYGSTDEFAGPPLNPRKWPGWAFKQVTHTKRLNAGENRQLREIAEQEVIKLQDSNASLRKE